MIALIIDREIKDLDEYTNLKTILNLDFFHNKLIDLQINELESVGFSEIIVATQKKVLIENDNINIVNDLNGICKIIDKKCNESIYCFPANSIFEISGEFLNKKNDISYLKNIMARYSYYDLKEKIIKVTSIENLYINIFRNYKPNEFFVYFKFINNSFNFKNIVKDALNHKVNLQLPKVCDGVFAYSNVPKGDFTLIPPVYFGENVQIERGAVVGPNTVIYNNTLIGENTVLKNTFIGEEVYVSSDCFLENSVCYDNVSVRKNSGILSNSVVGENTIIGEDVLLENKSKILKDSRIDAGINKEKNHKFRSSVGFFNYMPDKASMLGIALSNSFNDIKIGVLCDDEIESECLKLSFLSGAMSQGSECYDLGKSFLSSIFFFMDFLGLDFGVFIKKIGAGTFITIYEKDYSILSKSNYYRIKDKLDLNGEKQGFSNQIKPVRQIRGIQKIYVNDMVKSFETLSFIKVIFKSENKYIEKLGEYASYKISSDKTKNKIQFNFNSDGTRVCALYNGKKFSYNILQSIASYAKKTGKIKDEFNIKRALNDGVYLAFLIVYIMNKEDSGLEDFKNKIPDFYVSKKSLKTSKGVSQILTALNSFGEFTVCDDIITFKDYDVKVQIFKQDDIKKLKIISVDKSYEASEEISNVLYNLLTE